MKFLSCILLCFAAYAISALIWFGDIFKPIAFATFWSDRLAIHNWPIFIAIGIVMGLCIASITVRYGVRQIYAPPIFIVVSMTCATIGLGTYATLQRSHEVELFQPDRVIEASFFQSLRSSPRDFQFFLHGAALKDCIPYAWSYRTMSFYELPENVAANVLPSAWIAECQIERSR